MEIVYHMDCEDNGNYGVHGTHYEKDDCYKSAGLIRNSSGDVDWRVCIVDARKYKFGKMKYAYAIFDLSHEKFWNGAYEIFVHFDDEDKNNKNQYKGNTNFGFAVNTNYPYYPKQEGSYSSGNGWTNIWFYYFPTDPTSNLKLPNLGFEYDVFSNFNCCSYTKQNIFYIDSEDKKNNNNIRIFENAQKAGYNKNGKYIDATYKVMANLGSHIVFAVQSSSTYRY